MRFVVGDRLATHRYVQTLWNVHPNGQQPFASHTRMSLRKGLEKATATWAREQCLFSAGLWRSLAKEAEAREMAAHKVAAE
jgi:hypothetical protein